jgi:hypothetical protein
MEPLLHHLSRIDRGSTIDFAFVILPNERRPSSPKADYDFAVAPDGSAVAVMTDGILESYSLADEVALTK